MNHRNCHMFFLTALGVAAALALAPPAGAQLQSNNTGRALDANQRVGSGGTNSLENQVDYQVRNNLVTGNVAGGFGFQDRVGYGAPGAFRGSLGSDDLFRFRAESLGSAPAVIKRGEGLSFRGADISVYSNYTSRPAASSTRLPNKASAVSEGGIFRVEPGTLADGGFGNLPLSVDTSDDAQSTPGVMLFDESRRYDRAPGEALLSPQRVGDVRIEPEALPPADANEFELLEAERPVGVDEEPRSLLEREALRDEQSRRRSGYVQPQRYDSRRALRQGPAQNDPFAFRRDLADRSGRVAPTLMLGRLATDGQRNDPAAVAQRVQRIEQAIFGPSATAQRDRQGDDEESAQQTPDAYTQLMQRIQEQADESQTDPDQVADELAYDPRPEWMRQLQEPSEAQVRSAEDAADRLLRDLRGEEQAQGALGEDPTAVGGADAQEADAGLDARRGELEYDPVLDALLNDLSYDIRLDTMASQREGRLNKLFEMGEEQLAAGRFFNANRVYQQIRVEAPDNPLGRVGIIHAQLGAGLIRSAALNLRQLFENHPEMIATRYGRDLLPPIDRLQWLRQELQRMIDSNASRLEPGIMLAYLGHQVESRQLVRYGLAVATESAPNDPLLPMLRQIWLSNEAAPATQPDPDAE